MNLKEGEYHVVIDSKLENGSLTYGEISIPGKSEFEILLTCYVCHPSMCNDNLSGIVLLTLLAKYVKNFQNNYSIKIIFVFQLNQELLSSTPLSIYNELLKQCYYQSLRAHQYKYRLHY